MSGGCINDCYKVVTSKQSYFVKLNDAVRYPRMFECEGYSLTELANAKSVRVPKVIQQGIIDDTTYLVIEYIDLGKTYTKALAQLGHDLAKLHKHKNKDFGWEHDNYVGSLMQKNSWCKDWFDFYEKQRIIPLCSQLLETGLLSAQAVDECKHFLELSRSAIPIEKPSLLHGDLWSGNYLISADNKPYVVDPACYYGHREIDIAMTQLFGGFGKEFIDSYNETYPLQERWEQRLSYFQLYPLLVHAVLFGASYAAQVERIIHQPVSTRSSPGL